MDTTVSMMNQKTLSDPSNYPTIDERISQNMVLLVSSAKDIKERLNDLFPEVKEFWDDPDKYKESIYLKGY